MLCGYDLVRSLIRGSHGESLFDEREEERKQREQGDFSIADSTHSGHLRWTLTMDAYCAWEKVATPNSQRIAQGLYD
jgi:hypothetical protein